MRICARRLLAMIQPTNAVQTRRYCASSSRPGDRRVELARDHTDENAREQRQQQHDGAPAQQPVGDGEEGAHRSRILWRRRRVLVIPAEAEPSRYLSGLARAMVGAERVVHLIATPARPKCPCPTCFRIASARCRARACGRTLDVRLGHASCRRPSASRQGSPPGSPAPDPARRRRRRSPPRRWRGRHH